MFPILFRIGPLTLHTYGLMVALGFLAAYQVARRTFAREAMAEPVLEKLVFFLMLSGILGARILYFVVEDPAGFKSDPLSFVRIWEGGLVFYGGVMMGVLTLWIYSRLNKMPFLSLTDAFSAPMLIGHSIGRLGCFAAGCCYGKVTHSFLSVVFTNPESLAPRFVPLFPTQLYSSLGDLILFFGAVALGRHSLKRGLMTAYYLASYGTFRFFIEFLRGDDRGQFYLGLSPSQWIAIFMIAIGLGVGIYGTRREKN